MIFRDLTPSAELSPVMADIRRVLVTANVPVKTIAAPNSSTLPNKKACPPGRASPLLSCILGRLRLRRCPLTHHILPRIDRSVAADVLAA